MSHNGYSINPLSRAVNNFFEYTLNSSNISYIQPVVQQQIYVPPPVVIVQPTIVSNNVPFISTTYTHNPPPLVICNQGFVGDYSVKK